MGLLIDGKWHDEWYDTKSNDGKFIRKDSQYRNWVTSDGTPGPSGIGGFQAQAGRYHLYISLACPWAHRTLIFRALKGLEDLISISVVHPHMGEHGWHFEDGADVIPDNINQAQYMHQVYTAAEKDYTGRVTVPVLWDKKNHTIVSNESAEIIRMFNSAFDDVGAKAGDFYPQDLRAQIDSLNERIYDKINNGVYKAGFATSQKAYEEAVLPMFETLDWLEAELSGKRYLTGEKITEADWRLFTTLVRFDPVYVGHFKCNLKRIADYPNIFGYLCDLYQQPHVAATVNMAHIKQHYYASHHMINTTGIIPLGPEIDYSIPHNRAVLI